MKKSKQGEKLFKNKEMNMFVYQRAKSIENETKPIHKLYSFDIFNLHHRANQKNMLSSNMQDAGTPTRQKSLLSP